MLVAVGVTLCKRVLVSVGMMFCFCFLFICLSERQYLCKCCCFSWSVVYYVSGVLVSVGETLYYVSGVLVSVRETLYYVSGVPVSVGETLYYASGVRGDPVVILPSPSGSTAVSCEDHVTLLPVHGTLHGPCPLCRTYTIVYY